MTKIKRVSLFFRYLFQLVLVASPLLFIYAWMTTPEAIILFKGMVRISYIPGAYLPLPALTLVQKELGFIVGLLQLLPELFILYTLMQLFKLYENGEIFSLTHVRYIKMMAYALLLGQLINPIYQLLMGVVLTWSLPHRFCSITLDHTNVGIMVMAFITILMAWIMAEGCQLREEQQLTI